MSAHLPDAGNASLISSGTVATATTATTAMGVINEYAVVIGLLVSIVSLIVGICFKISASRKEALYREEESKRAQQQLEALTELVKDAVSQRQDQQ